MDSAALAWALRPDISLTVDYGQLAARGEIRASASICKAVGLHHEILRIDCSSLGSGELASKDSLSVAPLAEWWPYRNQLLISFAAAFALKEGLSIVVIGTVSGDQDYADGRPDFVEAMGRLLSIQEGEIRLEAPGIEHTTVSLCQHYAVPYEILLRTFSCQKSEYSCGNCQGCRKRQACLNELGYGA